MGRQPRQRSEFGVYHVIIRGNGKQILFESDADRSFFLTRLQKAFTESNISLLAWCLMGNHVHLLLDDPTASLSNAMHSLGTTYARYFNEKTGHVGSVFQGRFTSIPISSDRQLLQAVRYIHENPAKAGMGTVEAYQWSSFQEYLHGARYISDAMVLDLIGGRECFAAFSLDESIGPYYARMGKRIPDEEAREAAVYVLDGIEPSVLMTLSKSERDQSIRKLRDAGLSVRQIERLTGIGRYVITQASSGKSQASNLPK